MGYDYTMGSRSINDPIVRVGGQLLSHCDEPAPSGSLVRYAAIIDAGSSGSRMHIYKFSYCTQYPQVESEATLKVKPGLSSNASDPEAAARSLDPLLAFALKTVPPAYHLSTPIALKATAGLRMLRRDQRDAIIAAVKRRISTVMPFPLAKHNPVEVMSGRDEAAFGWLAINILTGALSPENPGSNAASNVFDLGGASTQFTFQKPEHLDIPNNYTGVIKANGKKYTLYEHSYLGYGVFEFLNRVYGHLADSAPPNASSVSSPCFPEWLNTNIPPSTSTPRHLRVNITGTHGHGGEDDSHNFEQCYIVVKKAMGLHAPCPQGSCSFDGVYQPDLDLALKHNTTYLLSYFYKHASPFGLATGFQTHEAQNLAVKVCRHNSTQFKDDENEGNEDLEELLKDPNVCPVLTYIVALLKNGMRFPPYHSFVAAEKIHGFHASWTLGVAVDILQHDYYYRRRGIGPGLVNWL
ncbi:Guanosine-diphosphatase [Spiromyces aspiralis]|uniref:Guanosine-diphosphatase n=1 Tax=Spiromyces aspiralis TaxID=68401 RepID=A0ACC1HTV0_9FUNG|nr:Guanosine-diphosphatase [Spiromyces aspiralis]